MREFYSSKISHLLYHTVIGFDHNCSVLIENGKIHGKIREIIQYLHMPILLGALLVALLRDSLELKLHQACNLAQIPE